MKSVSELTKEEFSELKETYVLELQDRGSNRNVLDSEILNHYEGICFVTDDFWCNQ